MKSAYSLGAAIVVLASVAGARANNMLTNGGMESSVLPGSDNIVYVGPTTNPTALNGWTLVSGGIDIVPSSYWQNTEGTYSVDMTGTPNMIGGSGLGEIEQLVSTTLNGTSYTLTFDYSINPENLKPADNTGEIGSLKNLLVQAIGADGSTVLASQTFSDTADTLDGTTLPSVRTKTNMEWGSESLTFTADGATTIRLTQLAPTGLPSGVTATTARCGSVIDNLDLDVSGGQNPTPEPASLALLSMGGLLLLKRRRTA